MHTIVADTFHFRDVGAREEGLGMSDESTVPLKSWFVACAGWYLLEYIMQN